MSRPLTNAALNQPFEDVETARTVGQIVPPARTASFRALAAQVLLNAARTCDRCARKPRMRVERAELEAWIGGAPALMSLWLACHLLDRNLRQTQDMLRARLRGALEPIPQVIAGEEQSFTRRIRPKRDRRKRRRG